MPTLYHLLAFLTTATVILFSRIALRLKKIGNYLLY